MKSCLSYLAAVGLFALMMSGCGFDSDPLDNVRPSAQLDAPDQASVSEWITLSATESQDEDGYLVRYMWELGDGSPLMVTERPTLTTMYNTPGSYTVNLTVVDNSGGKHSVQHQISVTP